MEATPVAFEDGQAKETRLEQNSESATIRIEGKERLIYEDILGQENIISMRVQA